MKFVGCTTSFSYWLKPPTSHLSQSHSMREVEKASLMDAQRRLKECIKKTQAVGSLACFLWRCSGHLQPQWMTKTGCNGIQLKLEMRTAPKNRHAPDGHLENEVDNGMAEPSAPLGPNDNLVHLPWSKPKRYPWQTPSRWWFCQKGSIFINFLFIHVYSRTTLQTLQIVLCDSSLSVICRPPSTLWIKNWRNFVMTSSRKRLSAWHGRGRDAWYRPPGTWMQEWKGMHDDIFTHS